MDADDSLEANAHRIWQLHGERAPVMVEKRIGALLAMKDETEAARWHEIAILLHKLMGSEGV